MQWRADSVRVEALRRGEQPATSGPPPVLILSCASEAWAATHGGAPTLSFSGGPSTDDRVASLYVRELLHPDDCATLPGLDHHDGRRLLPSRVRDAARLALRNTESPVEVAVAVGPELAPWDLCPLEARAELSYTLRRYLEQRPGAVVVLPDAGGPAHIVPSTARSSRGLPRLSMVEQWRHLARNVGGLASIFEEHYQIALCDAPVEVGEVLRSEQRLEALAGVDVAVCTWAGREPELAQHGWRAASALVGAALSRSIADLSVGSGMTVPVLRQHRVELGDGRRLRRPRLTASTAAHRTPRSAQCTVVSLGADHRPAEVLQDACLRRPLGDWSLPALWTVKQVIRRVEAIASAYVFATADEAMAIDLKGALIDELGQLIAGGVLVSPSGDGSPIVQTSVGRALAHPGAAPAPRLEATITAALAPWLTRLELQIEVDQQVQMRMG